jgi:mono/diheme cytochrome c family protein
MYICANENVNGAHADRSQFAPPTFKQSFRGGDYVGAGLPSSGLYAALDLRTNRIVWQKRFNDGCRSGSLVTAGGLVFLGRNDGRVTALDAADGTRLWQFQTEAPVNSSISTFMYKRQQLLVAYAGGGFLSAKKGDGVWLFGLEGTIDPLPPLHSVPPQSSPPTPAPARAADVGNGEKIYRSACVYCHGDHGQGGEGGGKAISSTLGVGGVAAVLRAGRNQMPAFGASMTAEQLNDVATFVQQRLRPAVATP